MTTPPDTLEQIIAEIRAALPDPTIGYMEFTEQCEKYKSLLAKYDDLILSAAERSVKMEEALREHAQFIKNHAETEELSEGVEVSLPQWTAAVMLNWAEQQLKALTPPTQPGNATEPKP